MRIEKRDAVVITREWYRVINNKIFKFSIREYPRAIHFRVSEQFTRGLLRGPAPISRHNFWIYNDKKRSS